MTTITTTDTTPRVWIGCLACYNAGRLVGDWHDASDAEEVSTADVHGRASSHEELWCFDIENIPVRREMSPSTSSSAFLPSPLPAIENVWQGGDAM